MERIALFFDTNYLFDDGRKGFSPNELNLDSYYKLNKTLKFVKLNDTITLFVPELVLCELLAQHKRKLKALIGNNSNSLDVLKDISIDDFDDETIENHYKSLKDKYSCELNVVDMPSDKAKLFDYIFEMSLYKSPPFPDSNESDKGFKDSIILLSLFEFAKFHHYEEYILISSDKELVENEEMIQSNFKQYCDDFEDVDEKSLKFKTESNFNKEFYDAYDLFLNLRQYLDETLFYEIDDNYSRAYYISVDHDLPIKDYYILYDNTRIYQIEDNLFEVEIFISIEPNYDEDPLLVPYEETIFQKECFWLEKVDGKWKHELYYYIYNIDYEPFIWDESFLNDEYP